MIAGALVLGLALVAGPAEGEAALRRLRLEPVARIAPPPPPSGAPLRPAGPGREVGAPDQYVDAAAVRSLLLHRRFTELTRHLEAFQAALERDPAFEPWMERALDALAAPDPDCQALLDDWVAATPTSFAPLLARGKRMGRVGWAERGDAFAAATPASNFDAMRASFSLARSDLERAISMRPRLHVAWVALYSMAMAVGDDAAKERAMANAVEACPGCLGPRAAALFGLAKVWGGREGQIEAFLASQGGLSPPRQAVLALLAASIRVGELEEAQRWREAGREADRMVAQGEYCGGYWRRGRHRTGRDAKGALADLERALVLCPGEPGILVSLARAHQLAGQYEQSAAWLRQALQADPNEGKARRWFAAIVRGLAGEADRSRQAGQLDDALRKLDLAVDLAPDDATLLARREALLAPESPAPETLAALERRLDEAPQDLALARRVDAALGRAGLVERAVRLWSEFLRRQPDSGRAYLERGGAHSQLGRARAALEDARRACELGLSEGCARVRVQAAAPEPPPDASR